MLSRQALLVSHRRHAPPFGAAFLAADRAIGATFLVKRVTIHDLVQDERLTKSALGADSHRPRRRLAVVLRGATHDLVGHDELSVGPGDAVYMSELTAFASRWSGDLLEIEWDPGSLDDGPPLPTTRMRLGASTQAAAALLAERLRNATHGEDVEPALEELLRALRAEGAPFAPGRALALASPSRADQPLMQLIDTALNDLESAPMLVDFEASLGKARSTMTRAIRRLHERYALLGRGAGRWRAIRDVYRLVVASILISHPDATPRSVAQFVGYGSVEALDHAFRNAALPSPLALGRAVRAA